jgi:tetratricopeptide (TPR) repeat protein
LASAEAFAGRGPQALATLETLRRLPVPLSADPRIDLTEAEVCQAVGDVKRQQLAAARAASRGSAMGALLVAAQARLLEAFALGRLGQGDKAGAAAEEARAIFASAGDRGGVGWALNRVGSVQLQQGALVKARKTYEQSLALLREIGYQHRVAAVLSNIGLVLSQKGELAAAKSKYQESQAIDTELGDKIGVAFDLSNIGVALHEEGEPVKAQAMLERALAVSREAGDDSTTGIVLQQVGDVLISLGELKRAREHELQALEILQRTGSHRDASAALFSLGELMALDGDVPAARNRHQEVLAIREGLGDTLQSAGSRLALAALELDERRPAAAESFAREAASVFGREEVGDKEALAWALLGRAQLDQSQLEAAQRSTARAEALAAASQSPARRLTVALAASLVRAAGGSGAEALAGLEAALAEANRRQLNRLGLEIRLALGQLELRGPKNDAGRRRLQALAAEARSRGFGLLAQRAADFLAAPPQSR